MAYNISHEFQAIARELTTIYKAEIKRKGLIKTGALYKSIKWKAQKTSTGWGLTMTALGYFSYLNEKYRIQADVLKSSAWKAIVKRIAKANSLYIKDIIVKDLNKA